MSAGPVFKIAVFAGHQILAAKIAVARAMPILHLQGIGAAFGAESVNLIYERVAAGRADQRSLEPRCRRRQPNQANGNQNESGDKQPLGRRLKKQEGTKDGREAGQEKHQDGPGKTPFSGPGRFQIRGKRFPELSQFLQGTAGQFLVLSHWVQGRHSASHIS